jgi:hypothetical protein
VTERRQFCPKGHDTFVFGRDSSYRCLECKRLDSRAARAAREAAAQAERTAELERVNVENERRREREYERALKARGDVAAEARWQRLFVQTLDDTGSRFGLCQWALSDGNPGACTNRTADVYCSRHNRSTQREAKRRRQPAPDHAGTPQDSPEVPGSPRSSAGTPEDFSRHRQKG